MTPACTVATAGRPKGVKKKYLFTPLLWRWNDAPLGASGVRLFLQNYVFNCFNSIETKL